MMLWWAQLGLNFAYMLTSNIGLELLAASPFSHDVGVKGMPGGFAGLTALIALAAYLSSKRHAAIEIKHTEETIPPPNTSVRIGGYPIQVVQSTRNAVKVVRVRPRENARARKLGR